MRLDPSYRLLRCPKAPPRVQSLLRALVHDDRGIDLVPVYHDTIRDLEG